MIGEDSRLQTGIRIGEGCPLLVFPFPSTLCGLDRGFSLLTRVGRTLKGEEGIREERTSPEKTTTTEGGGNPIHIPIPLPRSLTSQDVAVGKGKERWTVRSW